MKRFCFAHEVVDLLHADGDGFVRRLLQIEIERGVDLVGAGVEIIAGKTLFEIVVQQVDEIGRVARFGGPGDQVERRILTRRRTRGRR